MTRAHHTMVFRQLFTKRILCDYQPLLKLSWERRNQHPKFPNSPSRVAECQTTYTEKTPKYAFTPIKITQFFQVWPLFYTRIYPQNPWHSATLSPSTHQFGKTYSPDSNSTDPDNLDHSLAIWLPQLWRFLAQLDQRIFLKMWNWIAQIWFPNFGKDRFANISKLDIRFTNIAKNGLQKFDLHFCWRFYWLMCSYQVRQLRISVKRSLFVPSRF